MTTTNQQKPDFPFVGAPGDKVVVMWLDGIYCFVRRGWFFSQIRNTYEGIEQKNYEDDADKLLPG